MNVVVKALCPQPISKSCETEELTSKVLTNPSTIAQSSALIGVLLNRRDVKRKITNMYAAERHMEPDAIGAGTRVWFSCAS